MVFVSRYKNKKYALPERKKDSFCFYKTARAREREREKERLRSALEMGSVQRVLMCNHVNYCHYENQQFVFTSSPAF